MSDILRKAEDLVEATHRPLAVESSISLVAFERDGEGDVLRDWFLTIGGRRAFDLGFPCESCTWIFSRVSDAAPPMSPQGISERLAAGAVSLDDDELMWSVGRAVPAGGYVVSLLEVRPELTRPGDAGDYFANEFSKSSKYRNHSPNTDYYRTLTRRFLAADAGSEGDELFVELIVPLYPTERCLPQEVSNWATRLKEGATPAALAVSIIQSVHLYDWRREFEPDPPTHWVLTHYLLDGHHKMLAAAKERCPLKLVSLLRNDLPSAGPSWNEHVFTLRERAAQEQRAPT